MNISIIGAGRWGSFITSYLDSIGKNVTLYGRKESKAFQKLIETRQNENLTLKPSITLTTDLEQVILNPYIIISISSQNLRALLKKINPILNNNITYTFILCMKGLEIETGNTLSEIVDQEIQIPHYTAVWLGPGHVQSYLQNIPNCMVIDSKDQNTKEFLANAFSSNLIRFYYGNDLIGNEIGAATKNIIGIGAGMLDGLNLSALKGALMARATSEIARLIEALGSNPMSAYGLCHLGDYEATVFSPYSHNRAFGEAFIKNEPFTKLAEGFYTLEAVIKIADKLKIELPIINAIDAILNKQQNPKTVLEQLFKRQQKQEF